MDIGKIIENNPQILNIVYTFMTMTVSVMLYVLISEKFMNKIEKTP